MRPVYAIATHIVSSLGTDTATHWKAVLSKRTGIKKHEQPSLSTGSFYGSMIEPAWWQHIHSSVKTGAVLSPFEQMSLFSASQALQSLDEDIGLSKTIFILSSTKGNIEWLGQVSDERIQLYESARLIAEALHITHKPVVIAHACVSGVLATLHALRLLQSGRYEHAIVTGADRFTRFVLSGFQSFQAVADEPCRPFDKDRKGINLGEAAATIILSAKTDNNKLAQLVSGATSNDANHISGPSRTGEELAMAINKALIEGAITPGQVDMISAHGTATLYNDEMESKAFGIAGIAAVPLHSFKGYVGHTLGAAGIAESVMIIESLLQQQLIPSAGFEHLGVPQQLNVTQEAMPAAIDYVLKTASGFGGCNATALWAKA